MREHHHVQQIVHETISAYLGKQGALLKHDSLLDEEFGLDSTEMVCIAVDLERALGVNLKEIKFGSLQTPDDVTDAVWQFVARSEQKIHSL